MNQTSDPTPDFEIVFRAGEMEPHADVAPVGEVTFQLLNATDDVQDFALLEIDQTETEWRDVNEPVAEDDVYAVGLIRDIPARGHAAVTWDLEEGHYVLISNTPGKHLRSSIFELTVQPVE